MSSFQSMYDLTKEEKCYGHQMQLVPCSPRAAQLVVIRHVCGPVNGAKGITSQNTWVQGHQASYWYNVSCVQRYATCANHRHNTCAHGHLARHDTDCVQVGSASRCYIWYEESRDFTCHFGWRHRVDKGATESLKARESRRKTCLTFQSARFGVKTSTDKAMTDITNSRVSSWVTTSGIARDQKNKHGQHEDLSVKWRVCDGGR